MAAYPPMYPVGRGQLTDPFCGNESKQIRARFSIAQVNAGIIILPALPGLKYRFIDATVIAVGGAVTSATAVIIQATQTSVRTLMSIAVAALTQSTIVKPHTASVTMLTDGASYTVNDPNTAVTVGKTGSNITVATNIDFILEYVVEAA